MGIPKKRIVAMLYGNGHIRLKEQDIPELKPGMILIQVHASLVSPGTEIGGWRSFSKKRDILKQDNNPRTFGYSNSGVVLAVGNKVNGFKIGDRVACVGMGYALHANYAVIPQNLCVQLPNNVSFCQGSYAMLMSTALHAVRRSKTQLGEYTAVIGLGLVGQLTARLYQLAGNFVIGWDLIPFRNKIARKWGIDAAIDIDNKDEIEMTNNFTRKNGLDNAVLAFEGDANKTINSLIKCMKVSPDGHPMGRIVVVGWPRFQYDNLIGGMNNIDIYRAARIGPGYHDSKWEYGGSYPEVYVRWSARSNLELCMRLISERKLDVDILTSHIIPLEHVDREINKALSNPDEMLGVIFVNNM